MSAPRPAIAPSQAPSPAQVEAARAALGERIRETPVWEWRSETLCEALGASAQVFLKLELFQVTGTFKARGAISVVDALPAEERARGLVTVSAGNHALATAYAARAAGTTAKVVMPRSANAARVAGSRALGAEVILVDTVHDAFAEARRLQREEGRAFVHPFEGPGITLGTATVGLEMHRQLPELDAVVVPVGGGGLASGVASYLKQVRPALQVWGVEPEGADTMSRSFAAGEPCGIDAVRTIADSLAPPAAEAFSFALCRNYLDGLVRVSDTALRRAMRLLFTEMKLAVEPAGAAATAALLGPLAERLAGKRVALVVCGANIDPESFHKHLAAADAD
ncbi:MAG TPA: pyridoxal-phosphate dependent enzyme [Planctomycetota bacterium]